MPQYNFVAGEIPGNVPFNAGLPLPTQAALDAANANTALLAARIEQMEQQRSWKNVINTLKQILFWVMVAFVIAMCLALVWHEFNNMCDACVTWGAWVVRFLKAAASKDHCPRTVDPQMLAAKVAAEMLKSIPTEGVFHHAKEGRMMPDVQQLKCGNDFRMGDLEECTGNMQNFTFEPKKGWGFEIPDNELVHHCRSPYYAPTVNDIYNNVLSQVLNATTTDADHQWFEFWKWPMTYSPHGGYDFWCVLLVYGQICFYVLLPLVAPYLISIYIRQYFEDRNDALVVD
jgi:hypothetical protein